MSYNTLKYFLLCEYLNPQTLEQPKKLQNNNQVTFRCKVNEINQKICENLINLKNLKNKSDKLNIRIFGGIFEKDNIRDAIYEICNQPKSDESIYTKSYQKAASFVVEFGDDLELKIKDEIINYKEIDFDEYLPLINERCRFIEDSFKLSTAPWAVYNFKNLEKISMEHFQNVQNEIKDEISAINMDNFQDFIDKLTQIIGDKTNINFFENEVQIQLINYKDELKSSDMLNSFFIDDLQKALNLVKNNNENKLLRDYLTTKMPQRFDIRDLQNFEKVKATFLPENFPNGAFASEYTLMYSQQFAINQILKRFKTQDGFYAINGPPGTGKTTLLKDLIASIITQRAEQLATLDEKEIFKPIKDKDSNILLYELNSKLKGYEIVVSSSNNGAVENISKEIPMLQSVAKEYLDELDKIDYFKDISTKLLGQDSWGLICATLGSSSNRNNFIFGFYYKSELKNKDLNISDEFLLEENNKIKIIGFQEYLKKRKISNFNKAKEEFKEALSNLENIKNSFKIDENLEEKLEILKNKLPKNTNFDTQILEQNYKDIEIFLVNINEKIKEINKEKTNEIAILNAHASIKPGFFARLFNTKKYQKFEARHIEIDTNIKNLQENLKELKGTKEQKENELQNFKTQIQSIKAKEKEARKIQEKIQILENKLQSHNLLFADEEIQKEKSSPYQKDKNNQKTAFFQARVNVFLKALALHKAAIDANSEELLVNFNLLAKMFQNIFDWSKYDREKRVKIWQSLFFVAPVITSTFASFSRCFSDFELNEIGYLLVDEAGQAALPNAVGALMRSKKAVVVGDPLQLEPVVTLPSDLNALLLKHCNTNEIFNLAQSSVQARADFVQTHGTFINQQGKQIWLGSPLRVHSRCDNPMFEISNITTYDKMMIWNKTKNSGNLEIKSQWLDVKTQSFNGNFSKNEANKLSEILKDLEKIISKDDIKIISAFRDVVNNLKDSLKPYAKNIGTIHTMQGKEAKVVIFVLGGSSDGARKWAASKPNLLNVALTRAKQYVFIIGDKDKWGSLPYFSEAARLL